MSHSPVFIVASAYGAQRVQKHGQRLLASMAARCGASGFEIRRELFPEGDSPLDQLRAAIQENGLLAVYSAPWGIWTSGGGLNRRDLSVALAEARQASASYIKLPLGVYDPERSGIYELADFLDEAGHGSSGIQLMVENDPTPVGGNLQILRTFLENCNRGGVPVRLTFDIGNWSWTGEDAFEAAETLADYVVYVHCKQVADRAERTGPLSNDSGAAWRQVVARFPKTLPRGGEFPIVGDDLVLETDRYVRILAVA